MKKIALATVALSATLATIAAAPAALTGTYVEARTSEIFAGACIVNGEAATAGREALLAWKVDKGRFNGVRLDGMAVVAAVAADTNLSVREIGGDVATTRTALFVDARANEAQRGALVAMAKAMATRVIDAVAEVTPVSIEFVAGEREIRVVLPHARLQVRKEMAHDSTCGNKQWFEPLANVHHAELGIAIQNAFTGQSLGTKWSDPDKRSAFFGTFAY